MYMIINKSASAGFALLMTLIVVSVMVVITASIIELSRKQLALSVTARDSEIAFQAANAGAECVRYMQRVASTSLEAGNIPSTAVRCFGQSIDLIGGNTSVNIITGDGEDALFEIDNGGVTWNSDRCTEMKIYVATVGIDDSNGSISAANLRTLFPGYLGGNRQCRSGSACYTAAVSGYNKPCSDVGEAGTVRREVLLEF